MITIDATNLLLGRLATFAAKQALLGKEVRIINCEKAVISGKKENVFDEYLNRRGRGTPRDKPTKFRTADKLVRRTVRGMLPHKNPSGLAAYKRVLCYIGVPEDLKDAKPVAIKGASAEKLPNLNQVDMKTLSKRLGAKLE